MVGKQVHFSPQGDGPAHYTILNYQPSVKRDKSTDSDRSDYVEVGRWSENKVFKFLLLKNFFFIFSLI